MVAVFLFFFSSPKGAAVPEYIYTTKSYRHYGFWNFMGDIIMVGITGGLWLIWIFVREMRRR